MARSAAPLVAAAAGLPVAWIAGYSLVYSLGGIGLLSDGWTLRHWRAAFATEAVRNSVAMSFTIAAAATFASTVVALGVCLMLASWRRHRLTRATLAVLIATPATVAGLLVQQLIGPSGWVSRVASTVGVTAGPGDFPVLVNDRWSIGLTLALCLTSTPMLCLFLLNTWSAARIDRYCTMAESLGASRWQARWRVAAPMLMVRARPLIALTFLWSLGAYEIPLLLGRQSPQLFSVLVARHFGQYDLALRPQAFVLATVYLTLVAVGLGVFVGMRRRHD